MFFSLLDTKEPLPACLYFLWLVGMVQGNLRLVSIPWTERAAAEDPGQGHCLHRDRLSWQACPKSGPSPGFYRALELSSGMPTSVSKTVSSGEMGTRASPNPRWLVQEGKERTSSWQFTSQEAGGGPALLPLIGH